MREIMIIIIAGEVKVEVPLLETEAVGLTGCVLHADVRISLDEIYVTNVHSRDQNMVSMSEALLTPSPTL
jgi:hypothetical protein